MAEETTSSLVGKRISTTFRGLLHTPHSLDPLNPSTKQLVYDGQGSATSLNIASSGYGAQIIGGLSVTKGLSVLSGLNVGSDINLTGRLIVTDNINSDKDILLNGGGNVNDVYFYAKTSTTSLSAPAALNIGKINLIPYSTDNYEINFDTNKYFSIYVKKTSPRNLYVKTDINADESKSPLFIEHDTNIVNISSIRVSEVITRPTTKTPGGTNLYRSVIPVGAIMCFPTLAVPLGWFGCDGAEKEIALYGELFDLLQYNYGHGSGTNFKLPDLRGLFVRGIQTGAGGNGAIDMGRPLNDVQQDMIENHKHATDPLYGTLNLLYDSGTSVKQWKNANAPESFAGKVLANDILNGNNVGGGVETRPINMALLYCIKY